METLPFLCFAQGRGTSILKGQGRDQNKADPRGTCPQNLVRAHKMLRPRAQMALENVDSFQYLMCKLD